ncbi:hypothetical protein BD413DRAFT_571793 [Trametes elegans]|nr:hypothetical protein BD413DRAFT_571793 [Trametes elegans]
MPPSLSLSSSASRRSSGSTRQRENRTQNTQTSNQNHAGPSRRRKSRSPEARVDDTAARSGSLSRRKRRPVTAVGPSLQPSSSNGSSMVVVRSSLHEDAGDRGRAKTKTKPRPLGVWVDDEDPQIVTNVAEDVRRAPAAHPARPKRKERSRSRETARHARKMLSPDGAEEDDEPLYTGPLAQADYHRMRQEVELLRKQLVMSKKTIHKQSKVIDELRTELTTTTESHKTQHVEMQKLKIQSKKSEELVATVESGLTCQICMDLLLKPYGLSPCGHVLCMTCLLEWFKSAPPGEDEMMDEDYPDAILYRKKTCPCCRAVVKSRPIPVYLVKSLASAVDKAKAPPGVPRPSPPPDDEDPWVGIFQDPTEYEGYWSTDEDEEEEEDDEEDEDEEGDDDDDYWSFDGYGTGEDEDRYSGPYVHPRWAPPSANVSADEYPFIDSDSEEFKMLRRGATLQMIELFQMSYTHDNGLSAVVEDENVVRLGWNIELHPDDETGEEYIDWILTDMYDRPERWSVIEDEMDGSWVANRLVPQYEIEDEYENTDSEVWEAGDDDDDEM